MNLILRHKKSDDGKDEMMDVNNNSKPNFLLGGLGQMKKRGKFTDREMKYELAKWNELPMNARRAAEDLGFDKESWNEKAAVDSDYKHWWDLNETELQAVQVLGWDEDAWEHLYEHTSWANLPELQKRAATSAGFDEDKWDGDYWPENLNKKWDELADADKQAMSVLGWHKGKWD